MEMAFFSPYCSFLSAQIKMNVLFQTLSLTRHFHLQGKKKAKTLSFKIKVKYPGRIEKLKELYNGVTIKGNPRGTNWSKQIKSNTQYDF